MSESANRASPRPAFFPASFAQESYWLIDRLTPGEATYHIPWVLTVEHPLPPASLRAALDVVSARHEAVRTTFDEEEGLPRQRIAGSMRIPLAVHDLRSAARGDQEKRRRSIHATEAGAPFDLGRGPLLRAALLITSEESCELLLTAHHSIVDATSLRILAIEILTLARTPGRTLSSEGLQYADFAVWQREQLSGEALEREVAHWRSRLSDVPSQISIPGDLAADGTPAHLGAREPLGLEAADFDALRKLAASHDTTLFMVLLAALGTLLTRHCGHQRLLIGVPVSGRHHAQLDTVVGPLVNTVPVLVDATGDPAFRTLLGRVRHAVLDALAHQDLPFGELVKHLMPAREPGNTPLVQVMLAHHDTEAAGAVPGVSSIHLTDTGTAKFDLTVTTDANRPESSHLEYRTSRFSPEWAADLSDQFRTLLGGLRSAVEHPLSRLPIRSDTAVARAADWNRTFAARPARAGAHTPFETRARRTPDSIALVDGERQVSYRELNSRANRLARTLLKEPLPAEAAIGICASRSAELVVAILAVLKAGGMAVPLDPRNPAARTALLLDDSGAGTVLAEPGMFPAQLNPTRLIVLDQDTGRGEGGHDLDLPVHDDQLSYLLYTSGSTGRPKGVMLTHGGVQNYALWCVREFRLSAGGSAALHGSIGFDTTVITNLLPALYAGQRVHLVHGGDAAAEPGAALAVVNELAALEHSYLALTPSQLQLLADGRQQDAGGSVLARVLVVGGERLFAKTLEPWRTGGDQEIINEYGPTETVAACCFHRVPREGALPDVLPIGHPIDNTTAVVVDEHGRPCPPGIPGELCVGGAGVARGYLDRPGMTAAVFVPDEDSPRPGARRYRTGDRARYLPDGTLVFLGRNDDQVKIRGHRVEPGEVESALLAHPAVHSCAVLPGGTPGLETLTAYVGATRPVPTAADLQAFLGASLPGPFLPSVYAIGSSLPMSATGKVDRAALAGLRLTRPTVRAPYAAPRTEVETTLAAIWREVLGVDRVGVHDSFFGLGGHSLSAARMLAKVWERLHVQVALHVLFDDPTIASLAACVIGERPGLLTDPVTAAAGHSSLSHGQEGIWFVHRLRPASQAYNTGAAYRIHGALRADVLISGFDEVLDRHEVLRSAIVTVDGTPRAIRVPRHLTRIRVKELDAVPVHDRERRIKEFVDDQAGRPFDLTTGPLLRASLLRFSDHDHVFVLIIHHIVVDGWSMEILFRDLDLLYRARLRGQDPALPALPISYGDFAAWQRARLSSGELSDQVDYWTGQLEDPPEELSWLTDGRRESGPSHGGHHRFWLPLRLRDTLERLSRSEDVTLFMTLLAGFGLLLWRYTRQRDLLVGVPVSNRTRQETENLVGLFINVLVLRLDLDVRRSGRELLHHVRETATEAYANQELPFSKFVETLRPDRHQTGHDPLVQVLFNFQYTPNPSLKLADLEVETMRPYRETTPVDLAVSIEYQDEGLYVQFEYDTALFSSEFIVRMAARYELLLTALAGEPDSRIDDLTITTPEDLRTALDWSTPAPDSVSPIPTRK
ncbi:amino acid adenylation domain-containing protein [Amycolatopsis sp. QT-25]|nr:non-ribosomal peptide synthetase [Amycolatopsis sp. QT-25]WET81659.1 amino acid adenylation domain-containing protein [Amycolatopsis sp. QT-25]